MSKINDLKKKYPKDTHLLDYISDSDPSGTNKYLQWVVKMSKHPYINDRLSTNSVIDHTNLVVRYHTILPYIKDKSYRDIYNFSTQKPLQHTHQHLLESVIEATEKALKLKNEENMISKIYEDENLSVIVPLTHSASCKYGYNTRWCTASTDNPNHFTHYTNYYFLYYVLLKNKISDDIYGLANTSFMKIAVLRANGKYLFYDQQDVEYNGMDNINAKLNRFRRSIWASIFHKEWSYGWLTKACKKEDRETFRSWKKAMEIIEKDPKVHISKRKVTIQENLYTKSKSKQLSKPKKNGVDLVDAFNHMKLKVLWNHFFGGK